MVVISERAADRVIIVVIPECFAARRVRESVFVVVVLLQNDRSPTKFLGDDEGRIYLPNPSGMTNKEIKPSFPSVVVGNPSFAVFARNNRVPNHTGRKIFGDDGKQQQTPYKNLPG